MSSCNYRLIYFNLKGRAEAIRILFKLANQPFEDRRIQFSEWPELKNNVSFNQLPILEVEEDSNVTVIAQSNAIIRFMASQLGLSGKNEIEKAQCDMVSEQIRDILDHLVMIYRMKESEEKTQALESAISLMVPNNYKLIQNFLEANKNDKGFLVGDQITYADILLIMSYDWLRDRKEQVLSKLPALEKHDKMVCSIPVVAEHLKQNKNVGITILFK